MLWTIAAASSFISALTLIVAPMSEDLYNLTYEANDLAKEESTFVFLFFFPFVQCGLAACYHYMADSKTIDPEKGPIIALGSLFFLFVNSWRCIDVWMAFT